MQATVNPLRVVMLSEAAAEAKHLGIEGCRDPSLRLRPSFTGSERCWSCCCATPARIFGRATLLQRVWGDDFDGDDHTVPVHIQRLRTRLAEYGAADLIETVRGVDYRLRACR